MYRALLTLAAAVLLVGCGNDQTSPPDIGLIKAPGQLRTVNYPKAGVSLKLPTNWRVEQGAGSRVTTTSSGYGQISVWRYVRDEPLPVTRTHLVNARKALIAQIQARDPTFTASSSRLILRPGLRAIELLGVGTNQGAMRTMRSLHAYGHRAEVVVDAYAPNKDFGRVDAQTFRPVLRSLKLRAAGS
ncbi:MAG: hypothetical protein QOG15_3003 [Solirubrobacteraceae bacterium]|nr:hypothetical protein [Solirubrobacteraceae bacterium]